MHRRLSIIISGCIILCWVALPLRECRAFTEEDVNIIIENNVFHPQRKKWLMEYKEKKPDKKTTQEKREQAKALQQVVLYGTVQSDNREYAIIRITQSRAHKRTNTVYMVGDYVNGFLLREITQQSIVLADGAGGEQYDIFVNQGNKQRTPLKTAIQETHTKSSAQPAGGQKSKVKKAQTASVVKGQIKRIFDVLKRKPSTAAKKQAKRQFKKLEDFLPSMSYAERTEFLDLKKEYESLIN